MASLSSEAKLTSVAADTSRKRPRYTESWRSCLDLDKGKKGLSDLFGARDTSVSSTGSTITSSLDDSSAGCRLRLEHREGGTMTQHLGEERILLFRSDRPGAIAKIIYSSTPATAAVGVNQENQGDNTAQAKIHVLDVKGAYRGFGLGGLLFMEALASLIHRYTDESQVQDDASVENGSVPPAEGDTVCHASPVLVHCQLDAEEDVQRHNKLVGFYEKLGCHVKPRAKVLYLNNNDGETYRKVPMEIDLKVAHPQGVSDEREKTVKSKDAYSLLRRQRVFVPVVIFEAPGRRRNGLPFRDRVDWLMIEDDDNGVVHFRTTGGQHLCVSPDGHCSAADAAGYEPVNQDVRSVLENQSKFKLFRVSDFRGTEDSDSAYLVPEEARDKALWMLQSVSSGMFLTLNSSSHLFQCSKIPAFWQAGSSAFSLMSTNDTPLRRQHYRKQWAVQTVEYVTTMRNRYLGFNMQRMSLFTALMLAGKLPLKHFEVEQQVHGASLRTRCFRAAEHFRNAGHPDWVQLVALIRGLAEVLTLINTETTIAVDDDYDWTITSRARVVGCKAPTSVIFGEFRSLSSDECDPRYSSLQGMYDVYCGFDNAMLTWTGPEYMYYMLKHNAVGIPDEGLKMLRLASLSDWHTKDAYAQFATEDDRDMQSFVADFDEQFRTAAKETRNAGCELSTEECTRLWDAHYTNIASKYGVDGEMRW